MTTPFQNDWQYKIQLQLEQLETMFQNQFRLKSTTSTVTTSDSVTNTNSKRFLILKFLSLLTLGLLLSSSYSGEGYLENRFILIPIGIFITAIGMSGLGTVTFDTNSTSDSIFNKIVRGILMVVGSSSGRVEKSTILGDDGKKIDVEDNLDAKDSKKSNKEKKSKLNGLKNNIRNRRATTIVSSDSDHTPDDGNTSKSNPQTQSIKLPGHCSQHCKKSMTLMTKWLAVTGIGFLVMAVFNFRQIVEMIITTSDSGGVGADQTIFHIFLNGLYGWVLPVLIMKLTMNSMMMKKDQNKNHTTNPGLVKNFQEDWQTLQKLQKEIEVTVKDLTGELHSNLNDSLVRMKHRMEETMGNFSKAINIDVNSLSLSTGILASSDSESESDSDEAQFGFTKGTTVTKSDTKDSNTTLNVNPTLEQNSSSSFLSKSLYILLTPIRASLERIWSWNMRDIVIYSVLLSYFVILAVRKVIDYNMQISYSFLSTTGLSNVNMTFQIISPLPILVFVVFLVVSLKTKSSSSFKSDVPSDIISDNFHKNFHLKVAEIKQILLETKMMVEKTVEDVRDSVNDKIEEVKETVADTIEEVKESVSDKIEETKHNIEQTIVNTAKLDVIKDRVIIIDPCPKTVEVYSTKSTSSLYGLRLHAYGWELNLASCLYLGVCHMLFLYGMLRLILFDFGGISGTKKLLLMVMMNGGSLFDSEDSIDNEIDNDSDLIMIDNNNINNSYVKSSTLLFSLLLSQLSGFGITAGSHRLWSHRSYNANPLFKVLLVILTSIANQKSVYNWAREHRSHHLNSDTEGDAHNSAYGFFYAHVGWLLVKKPEKVRAQCRKVDMRNFPEDCTFVKLDKSSSSFSSVLSYYGHNFVKFLLLDLQKRFDPWFNMFWCFVFPTLFCIYFFQETVWNGFLYGGMVRYVFSLNCTWTVNSFAHGLWPDLVWGKREIMKWFGYLKSFQHCHCSSDSDSEYDNVNKDNKLKTTTLSIRCPYDPKQPPSESPLVSILAVGEGWHSYHHTFGFDYAASELGCLQQWNPTKLVLDVLASVGVVWGRKRGLRMWEEKKKKRVEKVKEKMKVKNSSLNPMSITESESSTNDNVELIEWLEGPLFFKMRRLEIRVNGKKVEEGEEEDVSEEEEVGNLDSRK